MTKPTKGKDDYIYINHGQSNDSGSHRGSDLDRQYILPMTTKLIAQKNSEFVVYLEYQSIFLNVSL